MKTRHPIWFNRREFKAGTEVRLATVEEVRKVFPRINYKEGSNSVAIWLPEMPHPTIVHRSQIYDEVPA